jgi:hypothetical protein
MLTRKDSEAQRQRFRAEAQSGHKTLANKHHPDKGGSTQQMDALLRKITNAPLSSPLDAAQKTVVRRSARAVNFC